jgi:hypothetical protein
MTDNKTKDISLPCEKKDGNINHTFDVSHQNSDANCFARKPDTSLSRVRLNPSICTKCVYSK